MSLILDPGSWLKRAVIITCTAAVLSQALVMPVQAIEQQLRDPAAAVLQIEKAGPLHSFKSKSLSGDEVVFISSENLAVKEIDPSLSQFPAASLLDNTAGEVVCAVSDNPGMAANLGNRIIQIDNTSKGAIVDAGLTRLATSGHEYGHCLDILARKDIGPMLRATGLTPYSVPGALINHAMQNESGTLDFKWMMNQSPKDFMAASDAGKVVDPLSFSLLETYADLHGALQTAATTGDLRGFTEFELAIRLNNLDGLTHTSAMAVATVLKAEQDKGFSFASLQGSSHEVVTAKVNEIFMRHFTKDGEVSIHSDGFKSMVKEFQLKEQLGVKLPAEFSEALHALAQKTDAVPGPQEKSMYLEMMQANVDHQVKLVDMAPAGSDEVMNAQAMLTQLQTQVDGHKAAFGLEPSAILGNLMSDSGVDAKTVRNAATDFHVRAINLGKGLESNTSNISKYVESTVKKIADVAPAL
ncbi:hypothetical protein [Pseudomonas viridiflava]|uniref:hypothetical protein n=1 Tax=Pseudomonas viridiflava TaxID=33069 RepID=UPI0013CEA95B|nr:hypothetical protein [Pseudomonas viridiflava]